MTEYEIRDVMFGYFETMNDQAAMYFTLVSAYLITSYLVGAKLSTRQITIINTLYILWILGTINAVYTMMVGLEPIYDQLLVAAEYEIEGVADRSGWAVGSFLVVQVGGVLASLYFMWSVRHPKTE